LNTRIKAAISSKTGAAAAAAVLSASISAVVTYKIASDRLEKQFAEKIEQELADTKKFFASLQEKPSLDDLVKDAGLEPVADEGYLETTVDQMAMADPRPPLGGNGGDGLLVNYNKIAGNYAGNGGDDAAEQDLGVTEEVEQPDGEVVSVFNEISPTDELPQHMIEARTPDKPYIITLEEFTEGENDADTLTYYEEDGVLADSQDMPVDRVAEDVGEENLNKFGLGSDDSRMLYVRNEKIGMDYEIILHQGSFAKVVHGITNDEPRKRSRTPREE
jgi:hypothetical protein